jgi:RNA polymerase sigma-70 factor (ECF subfamily)
LQARHLAGCGAVGGREDDVARFEERFTRCWADVLRFCARRSPSDTDAEEAATEVFTVAWRRRKEVPAAPEDRLWLFGVTRHVLANQHRGQRRRARLLDRLRAEPADVVPEPRLPADGAVADALRALSPSVRELLLLVGWEELEVAEIAVVLGVPGPVVSRRLHRARGRFAAALGDRAPAGHVVP